MQKELIMQRMRGLLHAGIAALALVVVGCHAQVHGPHLPPIPRPPVFVVDVHPVPPPHVHHAPPVRYRYVEHHYYERGRHHQKHKHKYDRRGYDRRHDKHHRYDDDD